jgi:carbonic anhydrase
MDTRIDPWRILNAGVGDIHVLRNAGGIVTADVERSLILSQRRLQTTRIDVIMHTSCGVSGLDEDSLNAELSGEGVEPFGRFGSFRDVEAEVRRGVARLRSNRALKTRSQIRGYVYDLAAAQLKLVVDS